jgi:hypothetical protein
MGCKFAAKPGQIESGIDLPHQLIFRNRVAKMKTGRTVGLARSSDGPSWIHLAEIRVNTTESRFAAYLNRLLQQNLPLPDSCTAASGSLFDQLVGAAKQRQRGQSKLAHRSPRFEFALVNLSQAVKCCLSDSDRGPAPCTKRVTYVTQ